jgi:hypothetical protein
VVVPAFFVVADKGGRKRKKAAVEAK